MWELTQDCPAEFSIQQARGFPRAGPDPDRRAAAFRRWLDDDAADLEAIRRHLAQERALKRNVRCAKLERMVYLLQMTVRRIALLTFG